jgi:hypothetical protein
MRAVEKDIIKVYVLQRDRLREQARQMVKQAPDLAVPPTWVVPMDVPAVDVLVGNPKPYLYYDRQRDRFTHIVHAFPVPGPSSSPIDVFPVHRVITIPEFLG